jgi:CheY-like chemotaxis protein
VLRVLCVEDSPEDATLVQACLEETFGQVALERVADVETFRRELPGRWDVVVADHCVPGFGGLEALRILQETGRAARRMPS